MTRPDSVEELVERVQIAAHRAPQAGLPVLSNDGLRRILERARVPALLEELAAREKFEADQRAENEQLRAELERLRRALAVIANGDALDDREDYSIDVPRLRNFAAKALPNQTDAPEGETDGE
jgi:hypothetical protein